jgi:hypothetical protein
MIEGISRGTTTTTTTSPDLLLDQIGSTRGRENSTHSTISRRKNHTKQPTLYGRLFFDMESYLDFGKDPNIIKEVKSPDNNY